MEGGYTFYKGQYFDVVDAKIFDLPRDPMQFFIAAGGTKSAELAARMQGGFCNTSPDEKVIKAYLNAGGSPDDIWGQVTLAWGTSESEGLQAMYEQFRFSATGGWKVQAELPNTVNFDAASSHVTPETFAVSTPHGPRPHGYIQEIATYQSAGFAKLSVMYPGKDTLGFMKFWRECETQLLNGMRF